LRPTSTLSFQVDNDIWKFPTNNEKELRFFTGNKEPLPEANRRSVNIENVRDVGKSLRCDALVDTDVSLMVLPAACKHRLGKLESSGIIVLQTGNRGKMKAEACGPVRIQIEGFRPIHTEVVFVDVNSDVGEFKPLIGNIVLAQKYCSCAKPGGCRHD
jgi:hypothetical protein